MSRFAAILLAVIGLEISTPAHAHFLVLLPSSDVVDSPQEAEVHFEIQFTHPMEQGPVMPMGNPIQFFVTHGGQRLDLRQILQERQRGGQRAFSVRYRLDHPGDYTFAIEPAPYWEKLEKKWIIHYTKVVVNFMGEEGDWAKPVGLPVEIQPLTRPYGLWAGNCFRGVVLHQGQPVPFADVEVEYWNLDKKVSPPSDAFVTQVIKADGQGVFCYGIPRAGWWGFAALVDGPEKRHGPDGQPADVELGGVIWVRAVDMVETRSEQTRPLSK
ncbi:MAG: DUF4198 domain-containing protein [Thermogutta sp.]